MNLTLKKVLLPVLAVMAVLLPELAFAQDFPFTVPAGDKSREWFIQGLFGELDGGGGSDPLRSIVGVFNSAVLLIGGVLLFYTLVGGTVRTAGEGKVLGRWDSVWLPIRTVLGVAAILPINGGYALIQYAVIWLALQGVAIADTMSGHFIDGAMQDSAQNAYTFDVATIKPEISGVVRQLVMNSACVAAFDEDIRSNASGTRDVLGFNQVPTTDQALEGIGSFLGSEGVSDFHSFRFGCGSLAMPSEKVGTDPVQLRLIDVAALSSLRDEMHAVHRDQLAQALNSAAGIGAQLAQSARNNENEIEVRTRVDQQIDQIATTWAEAALARAESQNQSLINDRLVNAIREDGWVLLGSWYMQLAMAQQTLSEALVVLPEVSVPDSIIQGARDSTDPQSGGFKKALNAIIRWGNAEPVFVEEAAPAILYAVRVTDVGGDNALSSPGTTSPKGMMSSTVRKAVSAFTGVDMAGTDKNPVILASEIGNRLIVSVSVAITALAIAAGLAGLGATVGTNIVLVVVSILSPLMITLLGAGLTLSYYIPLLPYILWLGAVFGWVILIVEAVIAAPLWAVTHLAPDGDGVVGRGGQGYMLVLSLTMRPALMVFGFAAAVAVMKPMGLFLNETFMGTFFGSVSPGLVGLLKLLAGSVIYATILLMIINRVFSLIHQVPDGILRWIGGGDNVIGREAEQASGGAAKAIAASTLAAQAGGAVGGAGQQIGNMARERRMADRNDRNATAGTAAQLAGNAEDKASRGLKSAANSASGLDPSSSSFEQEAAGVNQQADAAATASVYSIGRAAQATLRSAEAIPPGKPGRPSAADIQSAQSIVESVGKVDENGKSAENDPAKARQWLAANSGNFSDSKFGSQINAAAGSLSSVDAKLSGARQAYQQNAAGALQSQALSSVSGIHAKAIDTIEKAGEALPGDPNAPTQDQVSDAVNVRDSIERSGAMNSGADAQSWLKNQAGEFSNSTMGADISLAASRSANSKGSQNEEDMNG